MLLATSRTLGTKKYHICHIRVGKALNSWGRNSKDDCCNVAKNLATHNPECQTRQVHHKEVTIVIAIAWLVSGSFSDILLNKFLDTSWHVPKITSLFFAFLEAVCWTVLLNNSNSFLEQVPSSFATRILNCFLNTCPEYKCAILQMETSPKPQEHKPSAGKHHTKTHQRRRHHHKNTIRKIIREANIFVFVVCPRPPRCHPRGCRCRRSGRHSRPGGRGRCRRRRHSLRQCCLR